MSTFSSVISESLVARFSLAVPFIAPFMMVRSTPRTSSDFILWVSSVIEPPLRSSVMLDAVVNSS